MKAVVASSWLAGCHCQEPCVSVESGVIWKTINSELPYIVRCRNRRSSECEPPSHRRGGRRAPVTGAERRVLPRAHKTCFMFFVHKQTFIRRVGSRAPNDLRATIENELNTIYSTGLAVGDGGSSGGRRVRGVAVSPRLGLAAQNVFYSLTNKTCFFFFPVSKIEVCIHFADAINSSQRPADI